MKMTRILAFTLFALVAMLVQAEEASALGRAYTVTGIYPPPVFYNVAGGGYFVPVVPGAPTTDSTVRVGGSFGSASYYLAGLRGGIVTHPPENLAFRQKVASRYYPTANLYGRYGNRDVRVGGYFGTGSPYVVGTYGGFAFRGGASGIGPGIA